MAFNEALQNVVKHSKASEVTLTLALDRRHFVIRVSDNGCGLPDHPEKSERSGLENIGYLLKRSSPDELTEAIKQAVSGGAPMSPQIARQVVGFFQSRPPRKDGSGLSTREREIIDLLAGGLLYKEIAVKLDLKFETVRSYVKKIYEKLQAHSRTEAVSKWKGG